VPKAAIRPGKGLSIVTRRLYLLNRMCSHAETSKSGGIIYLGCRLPDGGSHARCERGLQKRCAIMCAETLWWQCHRRIISDYLIAADETIFHIFGPDHVAQAFMTPAAKVGADGVLTYPVEV
jgi:hypothetical protein